MSKEREDYLVRKMAHYEEVKWKKHNSKLKIKEKEMQKELDGFFQPNKHKSQKKLGLKKRNKAQKIIMGGKSQHRQSTSPDYADQSAEHMRSASTIFDRLYQESKDRKQRKQIRSNYQTQ